jgi:hypothetical protein
MAYNMSCWRAITTEVSATVQSALQLPSNGAGDRVSGRDGRGRGSY